MSEIAKRRSGDERAPYERDIYSLLLEIRSVVREINERTRAEQRNRTKENGNG